MRSYPVVDLRPSARATVRGLHRLEDLLPRLHLRQSRHLRRCVDALCGVGLVIATAFGAIALAPGTSSAAGLSPTDASWCGTHGGSLVGWLASTPQLPICGAGPAYGGSYSFVDLPGPYGSLDRYYNATPGFQCVELADRYLAVVDGLAPVFADGSVVVQHYHAAYPATKVVVNGSAGAVGHAPVAGDVISFGTVPSFSGGGAGHVAVVVRSFVDQATGDGTVVLAQENVSSSDYIQTLVLSNWRLEDPAEGGNADFQFPYAEWLEPGAGAVTATTGAHGIAIGAQMHGAASFVLDALVTRAPSRTAGGATASSGNSETRVHVSAASKRAVTTGPTTSGGGPRSVTLTLAAMVALGYILIRWRRSHLRSGRYDVTAPTLPTPVPVNAPQSSAAAGVSTTGHGR